MAKAATHETPLAYDWAVIPDLQVPYHDRRAVDAALEHVSNSNLIGLICVGDELDAPQPSRWSRGNHGEYADTLGKDIKMTHDIMKAFREALGPGKPFHVVRSNHGDRVLDYVHKYAPALAPLTAVGQALDVAVLLGYAELGITYHRAPYEFEPEWVLAHGDEGGLSQIPGVTARGLAQRWNKNIVCGHTHRAGLVPHTTGMNGNTRTLFGLEVGCLMDLTRAEYLKKSAYSANWQHALGIIHVERSSARAKKIITPELRFIVNGKVRGGTPK